jgi:hypothetical protein
MVANYRVQMNISCVMCDKAAEFLYDGNGIIILYISL